MIHEVLNKCGHYSYKEGCECCKEKQERYNIELDPMREKLNGPQDATFILNATPKGYGACVVGEANLVQALLIKFLEMPAIYDLMARAMNEVTLRKYPDVEQLRKEVNTSFDVYEKKKKQSKEDPPIFPPNKNFTA